MAHFSVPNSIPISWLYILIFLISIRNFYLFLTNSLISSISISWLIFRCKIVIPVHYLSMWFSSIIAIKIVIVKVHFPGRYLSGFSSQLLFSPLSCFSWLRWRSLWLCCISCTFLDSLLSSYVGSYRRPFCSQYTPLLHFNATFCWSWVCTAGHQLLLKPTFCSSGNSSQLTSEY